MKHTLALLAVACAACVPQGLFASYLTIPKELKLSEEALSAIAKRSYEEDRGSAALFCRLEGQGETREEALSEPYRIPRDGEIEFDEMFCMQSPHPQAVFKVDVNPVAGRDKALWVKMGGFTINVAIDAGLGAAAALPGWPGLVGKGLQSGKMVYDFVDGWLAEKKNRALREWYAKNPDFTFAEAGIGDAYHPGERIYRWADGTALSYETFDIAPAIRPFTEDELALLTCILMNTADQERTVLLSVGLPGDSSVERFLSLPAKSVCKLSFYTLECETDEDEHGEIAVSVAQDGQESMEEVIPKQLWRWDTLRQGTQLQGGEIALFLNTFQRSERVREDGNACLEIAKLYEVGEAIEQSQEEAVRWYRRAANLGNTEAKRKVTELTGERKQLSEAALLGDAEAQYALGMIYLEGRGGAKNLVFARHWLTKAAEQGHAGAKQALETLR